MNGPLRPRAEGVGGQRRVGAHGLQRDADDGSLTGIWLRLGVGWGECLGNP